jgi:hypothetical protein
VAHSVSHGAGEEMKVLDLLVRHQQAIFDVMIGSRVARPRLIAKETGKRPTAGIKPLDFGAPKPAVKKNQTCTKRQYIPLHAMVKLRHG